MVADSGGFSWSSDGNVADLEVFRGGRLGLDEGFGEDTGEGADEDSANASDEGLEGDSAEG
jgi:hypothetical protein